MLSSQRDFIIFFPCYHRRRLCCCCRCILDCVLIDVCERIACCLGIISDLFYLFIFCLCVCAGLGAAVCRFSNFRLWSFLETLERTFADSHCNSAFMCAKISFKRTHAECHRAHKTVRIKMQTMNRPAGGMSGEDANKREWTKKNTLGRLNVDTMQSYYLPRPALTVRYCSAYLFLFLQFFYSVRSSLPLLLATVWWQSEASFDAR